MLQTVVRRLSPGDHRVGDAAAEITVLRQVAAKVPVAGGAHRDPQGGCGASKQGPVGAALAAFPTPALPVWC